MATIKGIKVGTTTITATYTDGGVSKTSTVNFEVVKAAGSVTTAPTASNPVYGSGNYLCTAGSGTGTMYYRVGTTGNYSTSRPTTSGLNAGTYTVYYYAAESDSYNQSATGSISVTVGKATANPTFSNKTTSANLNPSNFTTSPAVNATAFGAATAGHSGGLTYTLGTVKNSSNTTVTDWSLTNNTSRVITVPASTPGGTYTATVTVTEAETTNYNSGTATATVTITVNKKDQTAPTATGASSTYATSGSITGSATGGGCTNNTINYKSDTNGGTNYGTATTTKPSRNRNSVGTTTFVAFWPGNDYWTASSNSSQASLVIDKATVNPTFNNSSVSANLNPSNFTTSGQVNCGAFTAATAGHGGSITYSIVSVNGGAVGNWTMTTTTSRVITVPASTAGGTYTIVVRATESGDGNYYQTTKDATITVTVNKKSQTAPTATGASSTYASSGSISGSATGGGCTGNTVNYKSDTNGGINYGTATTTKPSRNRNSVGTTTFVAFWPGNDYWTASSNSSQASLVIDKATAPATFSNQPLSVTLAPTAATTSPAVTCGAFTAATAGHGGSITYSIVSVNGGSVGSWTLDTSTRKITVPASTAGGTYTVVVRATEAGNGNYYETTTDATITITVNKKSQTAPTASGNTSTYATTGSISGSASGGGGVGSLYYKSDTNGGTSYGTATTTAPSRARSSVGTTTFVAYWGGNDYWAVSSNSNQASLVIGQADPTYTAPTAKTGLVYSGSAQTLYNAGSNTTPGSFSYSNGSKTDPGTYSVSWTFTPTDTTNFNTKTGSFNVTIAKFTPVITFTPNSGDSFSRVYNGSDLYAKVSMALPTGSSPKAYSGTIYYGTSSGSQTYNAAYSSGVGLSSVKVKDYNNGSGNTATVYAYFVPDSSCSAYYNSSATNKSQTLTISGKANQSAPTATGNSSTYATSGSISGSATGGGGHGTLMYKSDANGGTSYGTATSTAPTRSRSSVGTTTFVAYWAGDGNYNASSNSSQASLVISKATQSAPTVTATNATYNGTASASASGGGGQGTLYYKYDTDNGTNYGAATTTAPTRTAIGSTKVVAYWGGNGNYEASPLSTSVSITVSKYTPTVTLSATNRVYNGSPLYATATVSQPTGGQAIKGTIYYGTSSGSQTYSVSYTGSAVSLNSVSVTNYNGGSGNTATVWAYFVPDTSCNAYYNNSGNVSKELKITGRADFTASITMSGYTYAGTKSTPGNPSSNPGSGTVTYYYNTTNSNSNGTAWSNVTSSTSLNAGDYWMYATIAQTGNYNAYTTPTVKFTISKANPTYTAPTAKTGLIYNGSAQTLYNTGSNTTAGSFSYSGGSQTYASTYTVSWTFTPTDTTNYNTKTGSFNATIGKATPSVTVTGVNHTYDNTDYYAKVTKTDAKGTLYWKFGSAPTQSSYGGTTDISSVGTPVGNPSAFSTPINVTSVKNVTNQTLYWIFVPSSNATITTGQTYAANFNDSASGSVTMKINAAAITIPTISAVEVTYDKAAHSLTFPAVTGASITKYQTSTNGSTWTDASPATTNPSLTNVDTIYVRAYYTADSNHSGSGYTTGKTIKINPKGVTVSWGSTTWPYDGTAHSTTCSISSGVINGDSCTLSLANNSITYYGSQTVTASLNNRNYTISSGGTSKTISITKATPTISVTGVNKTYNNVDYYAVLTDSNVKGTVYWKKGGEPTISSNDGSKSISSTGSNLGINLGSIKLDADDHTLYWLVVPSSATNSLASGHTYAENYGNASGTVEMTINPKSISIGTPTNGGGVYNDAAYTASFPAVTGATITNYRYSTTNGSGWTTSSTNPGLTNAGTLYVQAYYTAGSNYTGSAWSSSATISVTKRPVTVTASTPTAKTYDGTALTSNSASASAQNNTNNTGMMSTHHLHSYTVSGSQTLAGSSNNTVSNAKIYSGTSHGGSGDTIDVTSNYNITYATGTLKVNKRSVTYKADNQEKVYNNTKLTATNTATITSGSLPTNHTVTITCSGEIGPGVTTGTKTLSSVVIKNGSGTDVSDSFNITKQDGTLTITNATITYSANSPVSTYCTSAATATDVTDSNREIVISSTSATDYSGAAITNGSNPATQGYTISQSGWSVSSDGKKIIVPANVAAGTYNNVKITVAKPNHTSKEVTINVTITATVLTGIVLTLKKTSIAYQATTEVDTLIATYNNGATKDVKDDANTTYAQSANPAVVQFL